VAGSTRPVLIWKVPRSHESPDPFMRLNGECGKGLKVVVAETAYVGSLPRQPALIDSVALGHEVSLVVQWHIGLIKGYLGRTLPPVLVKTRQIDHLSIICYSRPLASKNIFFSNKSVTNHFKTTL